MGLFYQKMCLFFFAYFICIAKRNNFVEEICSIRALFRRENSKNYKFENSKITVVPFFAPKTEGHYPCCCKKLSFQIEFSQRKRARNEKISSTKLFLFTIRTKKAQKMYIFCVILCLERELHS
jgi:hypothetical protein